MDTHAMADQIREMGGAEFADPQDVHDTLAGMHELVQAMQDTLNGWGLSLAETGTHPVYAETVHEASSDMAGIADKLESVISGGVMRGPGG